MRTNGMSQEAHIWTSSINTSLNATRLTRITCAIKKTFTKLQIKLLKRCGTWFKAVIAMDGSYIQTNMNKRISQQFVEIYVINWETIGTENFQKEYSIFKLPWHSAAAVPFTPICSISYYAQSASETDLKFQNPAQQLGCSSSQANSMILEVIGYRIDR